MKKREEIIELPARIDGNVTIDGFQSGGANPATMTAPLHACQHSC